MATETNTKSTASKVPNWVQAELFVDILKESVQGFAKIKNFNVKSGSAVGENYATIMLRVNIEVELEDGGNKSVAYMLKVPQEVEMFQKMMESHNFFTIERDMYKTIVPEMEQLYNDVGIEMNFGAKTYEFNTAISDYVLLEDLAPRGFKNTNRVEGLDQVHSETALRKLSQWHAASAVRVATKGPYPEGYNTGYFQEELREMMTEFNKSLQKNFLKNCMAYEGHEEYIEQLKSLEPNITDQLYKMTKPDPTDFNVLNHGDFWSNNMMFSYDAFGKIKEIYMIDFQLPKYGTVAQDLYYFIMSSTKYEDKLAKFDYYIKFYHENLVENLKLLKYSKSVPTLKEIHISLFKYGLWGYITATGVMSAVLVDPTESANIENFLSDSSEGTDFKTLLYSNPRYRKHMQIILPWLLNRGVFDGI